MDQGNRIRAGTPGTTGVVSSEPCVPLLAVIPRQPYHMVSSRASLATGSYQAPYASMFMHTAIPAEF